MHDNLRYHRCRWSHRSNLWPEWRGSGSVAFRCTRGDREEPLKKANHNSQHSKDDNRQDSQPRPLATDDPDNDTNSDQGKCDDQNQPAHPRTPLAPLPLWLIGLLHLLLLCHATISLASERIVRDQWDYSTICLCRYMQSWEPIQIPDSTPHLAACAFFTVWLCSRRLQSHTVKTLLRTTEGKGRERMLSGTQ